MKVIEGVRKLNIFALFGFCLFIYFTVTLSYDFYHLANYGAHTLGKVTGMADPDYKGNKTIEYEFTVNGQVYKGSAYYHDEIKPDVGDQYLVKYSSKDPSVNRMQYE